MRWNPALFATAWRDLHPVTLLLVTLVVAVGCIPFAAALALYALHSRAEMHEAEVNARRTAALLLRNFEQSVEPVDGLLQSFVASYDPRWSPQQVHMALKGLVAPASVLQIAVVDRNGHFVANNLTPPTGALLDLSQREHIRIHMEADKGWGPLYISKPVIGTITKRWNILLERVLDDGTGHFGGLIVASYAIADFINFYKQLRIEDGMLISLMGDDGVVRARAGAQTSFGDDVSSGSAFKVMKGKSGGWPYHGTSPLDGVERVGYILHSDHYPFMMLVAYSMDYIAAQTSAFRNVIWSMAAGLALALLLVALLAGRYLRLQNALREGELQALARQREAHVLEAISRVPGISVMHVAPEGPVEIGSGGSANPLSRLLRTYLRSPPFLARTQDLRAPLHTIEHLGNGESELEVEVVVAPLTEIATDGGAEPSSEVVVFAVDQTSRRMEEHKLYQLSKLASLGEVATGLAHEINQPLGVIHLAAANALTGIRRHLPVDHAEAKLDRIIQQTVRMSRIIDHMRIFGRPSGERMEPSSPLEAIDGALQVMGAQLHLEDIDASIVCTGEVPRVLCRQDQLEQVIINLLQNARDAIQEHRRAASGTAAQGEPGGAPPSGAREAQSGRITLSVGTEPGPAGLMVRMDVADDAGGIPAEILDRVFQPFFTTKPPGKGTGLGLSVSFGIIRDHGGSMSVANGPHGAIFTLRLPAAPAALGGEALAAE